MIRAASRALRAGDTVASGSPSTGLVGAIRPASAFIDASDLDVGEALAYLQSTFKSYIREDRLLGPLRLILALIPEVLALRKDGVLTGSIEPPPPVPSAVSH